MPRCAAGLDALCNKCYPGSLIWMTSANIETFTAREAGSGVIALLICLALVTPLLFCTRVRVSYVQMAQVVLQDLDFDRYGIA